MFRTKRIIFPPRGFRLKVSTPSALAASRRVSIAYIDPARARLFEHPPYLVKNGAELVDVFLKACFEPKLAFYSVVPQGPIRRAGDNAINTVIWQSMEYLVGITAKNLINKLLERLMHGDEKLIVDAYSGGSLSWENTVIEGLLYSS